MEDAAIYKVQLDGTIVGKVGSAGKLPTGIRACQLDRLPQRERVADWRDDQLARPASDPQEMTPALACVGGADGAGTARAASLRGRSLGSPVATTIN